jgi:hypothetical protein
MTTSLGRRAAAITALIAGVLGGSLLPAYDAQARPPREPATPAAASPTATPFPLTGLPTGDKPGIAYAFASKVEFQEGNWRLHRPDGTTLRLPRITWSVWAPMGRGVIGMAGTEAGPRLDRVTRGGAVTTRSVPRFGLAVSPDDRIVGWFGSHHTPHVVEGGGTRSFAMPTVPHGTRIATIAGRRTCQEQAPEGGGCTVFVNQHDTRAWISTSHGIVDTVGPMRKVADVSNRGRATGLVSPATGSSPACWGVFSKTRRLWKTCDYRLSTFAPGGRRVLAERTQVGSESLTRFAILGRGGHVVRSWTFDPGARRSVSRLTWEDPRHLLGVLFAHRHWSVVRIGVDGTVEYAVPPVAGVGDFSPYSLPLR